MHYRLPYRGWTIELTNELARRKWHARAVARDGTQLPWTDPCHDRLAALSEIKSRIAEARPRNLVWSPHSPDARRLQRRP